MEIANTNFKDDLEALINKHSLENICDMPDFLMADMICGIISQIGIAMKLLLEMKATIKQYQILKRLMGVGR